MAEDLLGKALRARHAVMELCQAIERRELQTSSQGLASAADQIALRDQLIEDLVRALGDICAYTGDLPDFEEALAKGRHVLDNVRDALPKAGE